MIRNKPALAAVHILLVLTVSCKPQPVFSQKAKVYDLVKDFNAKADDKTDNYLAFVKAAEVISKAGGGTLNIPKGRYFIASYKITQGAQKNKVSDIVFENCKGLTIVGNNSVIRVNGNFSRNKDYQLPGLPYNYAYNNTVCPFKLINCKNVLLKDITLYGEVDKMRREAGVVEGENYGVFISDDEPTDVSSNIVIQNVTAHHFAADGLLIKSNGEGFILNKCNSYNNARQGLSIVKGKNIKVLNSSFDSTGKTGAYGWHMPGAGIDVENEFGWGTLSNVLIRNCNLRGNNGFQIVTTLPADKVVIDSCFISDPTAGYSDALNGVGMYSLNSTLSNCILFAGIQVDIADQIYKGPAVQEINKNIIYSGNRFIVSSDFFRPVNITDNIMVMLPKPDLDAYSPYIDNPNGIFNRNIVVVHAERIKKNPNQITALIRNLKEAKENFWLVNGYDIPVEKQRSVYFIPSAAGTKNLGNQFVPDGDIVVRFNIPRKNVLTNTQVKEIFSKELFTAYKQNSLNRKYLVQANELRKYTGDIVSKVK